MRWSLFVLVAGVALGCARHQSQEIAPGREFELAIGQRAALPGGLALTFAAVVEDSRCPVDAICIQAGRAAVRLSLTEDGRTRDLLLMTREGAAADTVEPLEIRLVSLLPPPRAATPTPADSYRVTLLIDSIR